MTTGWKHIIAGGAAIAALGAGIAPASGQQGNQQPGAATQGQATGAQTQAQAAGAQQFATAERNLRQAIEQMQNATGQQAQQAVQAARQALQQVQQAIASAPADRRSGAGYRTVEREVNEANRALQGNNVDTGQARSALQEVVAALPAYRNEMGIASAGGGATGADIVIREQAAQVQVQQSQPQVTVNQPQPVVTVVVPRPEIIVRQAPPQVTVQMPEPQVAVQQQQPQVRVVEAQPQVNVQPGQPQVQVRQAEPRVIVQQQGQPVIRYEQQGEAQVNVQREAATSEGLQQRTLQGQAPAVANAQTGATATPAPAQGTGTQQVAAGIPLARAQALVGTNVVGANGRDAGEVENLLIDRNGQVRAAVVEWGGFLGIGERRAVVPIDQIQFGAAGERARLDMTRAQLEQLGGFDRNNLNQYGTRYGWGDGVRLYR